MLTNLLQEEGVSHTACIFRPENLGRPVGRYLSLGRELKVKGKLSGSAPSVRMLCIEVRGSGVV
jgi:hypothetical protein